MPLRKLNLRRPPQPGRTALFPLAGGPLRVYNGCIRRKGDTHDGHLRRFRRGRQGPGLAAAVLCGAGRLGHGTPPHGEAFPTGQTALCELPDRWFSLSHSGGLALCALSGSPVGVDVELVRPRRPGLPAYALSETELAAFDGSWEDFDRIWTLKEAWCKREDSPLYPPRAVVTPPPCPHGRYAGTDWRAAVCCGGEPPQAIFWVDAGVLREP